MSNAVYSVALKRANGALYFLCFFVRQSVRQRKSQWKCTYLQEPCTFYGSLEISSIWQVQLGKIKKRQPARVSPFFFWSGESAIRSNPHFVFWHWAFILATHLDLTAPNSLAHGSRLLECTTSEIGHYLIGGLWAVCLVLALPTWLGFNCIRALAMSFDFWLVLPTNWYLFMVHCSFTFSYQ